MTRDRHREYSDRILQIREGADLDMRAAETDRHLPLHGSAGRKVDRRSVARLGFIRSNVPTSSNSGRVLPLL